MTLLLGTGVFGLVLCALGWLAERGVFDRAVAWLEGGE